MDSLASRPLLYELGKKLDAQNVWTRVLPAHESRAVRDALATESAWSAFLNRPTQQKSVSESTQMSDDELAVNFRVRSVLYEQMMSLIYPEQTFSVVPLALQALLPPPAAVPTHAPAISLKRKIDEVDNYDEDEDSEPGDQIPTPSVSLVPATSSIPAVPLGKPPPFQFRPDASFFVPQLDEEMQTSANSEDETNNEDSNAAPTTTASGATNRRESQANRELRGLLPDVKPKRWHTSLPSQVEIPGLEELYNALENVIGRLKAEESFEHFLNKVRKKDAVDYYDVIKNPMDLSLMTKKLKKLEYSSKSEFAEDLALIFQNCREYNTDHRLQILKDCAAAEKKAREIMLTVPDLIVDLTIATTDSNGEDPMDAEATNGATPTDKRTSRRDAGRPEASSFMSLIRRELPEADSNLTEQRLRAQQLQRDALNRMRAQCTLPFEDREAIVRTPGEMRAYSAARADRLELLKAWQGQRPATSDIETPTGLLPETQTISFLPDLPPASEFTSADWHPTPLCTTKITQNVELLSTCRDLRGKIQKEIAASKGTTAPIEIEMGPSLVLPPLVPPPGAGVVTMPPVCGEDVIEKMLEQAVVVMLAHAGFENIHERALEVLVDVVKSYFYKLGKVARIFADNYGRDSYVEDMLMRGMGELGLDGARELQAYHNRDVVRYGEKLRWIKDRMIHRYEEILHNPDAATADINDDDPAFMSGFFDGLELDILGIRELGVEANLAVYHTMITENARERAPQLKKARVDAAKPTVKFPPPPVFEPILPELQIGLLRGLLERKQEEGKGQIIEGTGEPQAPSHGRTKKVVKEEEEAMDAAEDDPMDTTSATQ